LIDNELQRNASGRSCRSNYFVQLLLLLVNIITVFISGYRIVI
jgi:hypothetical protein